MHQLDPQKAPPLNQIREMSSASDDLTEELQTALTRDELTEELELELNSQRNSKTARRN